MAASAGRAHTWETLPLPVVPNTSRWPFAMHSADPNLMLTCSHYGQVFVVEADAYTPAAPNASPPAQPNPLNVNLDDNVERLKLAVDQILPLHGRKVPLAELQKWIGKTS